MKKAPTFCDQIRAAVDDSGLSRYEICRRIGLGQPAMSRFMHGKGGLSLAMLDRLAELLGLTVVAKPLRRPKGE